MHLPLLLGCSLLAMVRVKMGLWSDLVQLLLQSYLGQKSWILPFLISF